MKSWVFNEDHLNEALGTCTPEMRATVTEFLYGDAAVKFRIEPKGSETMSHTTLNPTAAWPFPKEQQE